MVDRSLWIADVRWHQRLRHSRKRDRTEWARCRHRDAWVKVRQEPRRPTDHRREGCGLFADRRRTQGQFGIKSGGHGWLPGQHDERRRRSLPLSDRRLRWHHGSRLRGRRTGHGRSERGLSTRRRPAWRSPVASADQTAARLARCGRASLTMSAYTTERCR